MAHDGVDYSCAPVLAPILAFFLECTSLKLDMLRSRGNSKLMKGTPNNPAENVLPSGITDALLSNAVISSGYPLQTLVAKKLSSDFAVAEEWGYIDRQNSEHRSLDVFASRDVHDTSHLRVQVALLIECKRTELPYVFFKKALQQLPYDFPAVTGMKGKRLELHRAGIGSREVSVATFLKLKELEFIGSGPPVCSSLARAERQGNQLNLSGEQPFKQIIFPLISALHHLFEFQKNMGTPSQSPICPSLSIGLLDAPMLIAEGDPESPLLSLCPWVRVVRQEAMQETRFMTIQHYVVDFVHRHFLPVFIQNHVLPFAHQFARRAADHETVLRDGRALVPDWENWALGDLKKVP